MIFYEHQAYSFYRFWMDGGKIILNDMKELS